MGIVSPALSLGLAVHEVLEGLADFKAEERLQEPLLPRFDKAWRKVSGKRGGFTSEQEEREMNGRAVSMIERVEKNPGPLLQKTIKIKDGQNGMPPNYFLSEEENIILCGKIDWLIYHPEDDSVSILDFKTGKNEEKEQSLQLPIYQLLLKNLQKRKVSGASYWYIDKDDKPITVSLPDVGTAYEKVIAVAREVKKARERAAIEGLQAAFVCPNGHSGCFACRPFEKILKGEAESVGVGDMRQELFIV